MNPIREFREIAAKLEEMNKLRAKHPEMFLPGSPNQLVYKKISEELDAIMQEANKLIERCNVVMGL